MEVRLSAHGLKPLERTFSMANVNPWNGYNPRSASAPVVRSNIQRQVTNSAPRAGSVTPWGNFNPNSASDRARLADQARRDSSRR